jgi:hypothetical protein
MRESSKERLGQLLMEELLAQLAERENIKKMLGDMLASPVDDLISQLLDDFEQIVARYRQRSLEGLNLNAGHRPRNAETTKATTVPPADNGSSQKAAQRETSRGDHKSQQPLGDKPLSAASAEGEKAVPTTGPRPSPLDFTFTPLKIDIPPIKIQLPPSGAPPATETEQRTESPD